MERHAEGRVLIRVCYMIHLDSPASQKQSGVRVLVVKKSRVCFEVICYVSDVFSFRLICYIY